MSKPGIFSRERDARRAAKNKGLNEDAFEIVKGPKGFTYREKVKYTPVPNAKLHVGKEPERVIPIHQPATSTIHLDTTNGRYRYHDDKGNLSIESFETVDEAEAQRSFALNKEVFRQVLPELAPPKPLPDPKPVPGFVPPPISDQTPEPPQSPPEKRQCGECGKNIDTFVSGEKLFFIEHERTYPDLSFGICNNSEEEVTNASVGTGIPESHFKPHELAQIRGEAIPSGTFGPLPPREPIPVTRRSTVERPSKLVWDIAEEMLAKDPKVRRKDVLAECVRRGIAYYTARTQYQTWMTVKKESLIHQNEVNNGKADS